MEQLLCVDNEEMTVKLLSGLPAEGTVLHAGKEVSFACLALGGDEYLLTLGERNIPFCRFFAAGEEYIFIEGETYRIHPAAAKIPSRAPATKERELAVTPPMPAQVIRLPLSVGQEVKRGEALVVLSAMKMEMTLTAPKDGRVARINTSVGTQVRPGEILVEIEDRKGGGDGEGT
jgi:3-methylcrotonyl-CoA carboxylase alpha subunit